MQEAKSETMLLQLIQIPEQLPGKPNAKQSSFGFSFNGSTIYAGGSFTLMGTGLK